MNVYKSDSATKQQDETSERDSILLSARQNGHFQIEKLSNVKYFCRLCAGNSPSSLG